MAGEIVTGTPSVPGSGSGTAAPAAGAAGVAAVPAVASPAAAPAVVGGGARPGGAGSPPAESAPSGGAALPAHIAARLAQRPGPTEDRFREVWNERKEFKARADQAEKRRDELANYAAQLEEKLQAAPKADPETQRQLAILPTLRAKAEDLDVLLAAIRTEPELHKEVLAVYDRFAASPAARQFRGAAGGTTAVAAAPAEAKLPAALEERIDRLVRLVEKAEKADLTADQRRRRAETDQWMDQTSARFLTERQYDPAFIINPLTQKTLLQWVRDYVELHASDLPGGGGRDDLLPILNMWLVEISMLEDRVRGGMVERAATAATTHPASAPGGAPPVTVETTPQPLRSKGFRDDAMAYLASLRARNAGAAA